jgi:hypothetical protein
VAALERQLARGDKALVGNTGYRRYLKTIRDDHFAIDPDKVEEEKGFDGIFVLRTNTDLNPLEAMLCYKQLWTVEQTFRTAKHLFSTRSFQSQLAASGTMLVEKRPAQDGASSIAAAFSYSIAALTRASRSCPSLTSRSDK